jgi:ankyrin repeat protein
VLLVNAHLPALTSQLRCARITELRTATSPRPLHTAAGEGHVRIVRRLMRAGANPNVQVKGIGTPLHLAACYGHLDCARALVRAGADVGLRDAEGKSAMDYTRC